MPSPPPTTAAAFTVHVNGERFDYDRSSVPSVSTTLAAFLRRGPPLLTGTKVGCGEGGCGACTVAVRYPFFGDHERVTVNACITPLLSLNGAEITTVEGITQQAAASACSSSKQKELAAAPQVLERLARLHASQCGFCTPGMAMSLHTLLHRAAHTTDADLRSQLLSAATLESVFDGNLCRCTGYRPLLDAAKSFALDLEDVYSHRTLQKEGAAPSGAATDDENENKKASATADGVASATRINPLHHDYYDPIVTSEASRVTSDTMTKAVECQQVPLQLKYPAHQRPGASELVTLKQLPTPSQG
jgi:xanthine dehydrogenase iron-sulfur cluster and FAD-binding subunit A